tara:strand:- start:13030 stop:13956 length:927 start_codon:yes stop_codon:yes gene_type:complete
MANKSEAQLLNETLFEQLSTPGMEKTAIDAVNDFTRTKMREDGFYRRILPPLQISNDELDRQVDTDKPVKVVDKEPDSPAAISIPFATLPMNLYIRGPRYRVMFDRIVTPRFTKDVDELRTYSMDIRQVLSDNAIKDMLAEEDSKFLTAVDSAIGAAGSTVATSGVSQHENLAGGLTRDTVVEALKIMPKTPSHLEVSTVLCNNVTIKEIMKWGRDEAGGDFSQDTLKNGWSEAELLNCRWIISIKRDLVADDSIYMFADPKFIGKNYLLEDTTMYIKREAYMLEFFAYETAGGTIGHTSGIARANFT